MLSFRNTDLADYHRLKIDLYDHLVLNLNKTNIIQYKNLHGLSVLKIEQAKQSVPINIPISVSVIIF